MAKVPCVVCGKKLGLFSNKVSISDGVVCSDCLNSAGMSTLSNGDTYDQQFVKALIDSRQNLANNFSSTSFVSPHLEIDEKNKAFKIGNDIFAYDNLLSFELIENGESITKGGLGRAVAGGLLFGGVGAVVGGVTGRKKSKEVCKSLRLRVSIKNAHTNIVYINFITSETKMGSFIYNVSMDSAQRCIAALETINDFNQNSNSQSISVADEIIKFKNLLDQGIITQTEFETKKKELLSL